MPGKRAKGVQMYSIPVHKDLWEAAKARAEADERPLRTVIRELIRAYAHGTIQPPAAEKDD